MMTVGIHDLEVATTHHVLDLAVLAAARGVDPDKYRIGLGQHEMSMPAVDEDVVTLGAAAALPLIERHGTEGIRTLLFATESGVDQSKSAAAWTHRLLGLPPQVRVVELKQACYAGTAALQTALGIVARSPTEKVLVIASYIARYALDSPGEPTQGAGAVAFLVTADPALVEIEPVSGIHTADIDDFWRPNDSTVAVVDGALSLKTYLDAATGAWDDFVAHGGETAIDRLLFHQPFGKMAVKAQQRLARHTSVEVDASGVEWGAAYNRRLGNTYTASVYAALAALLDHDPSVAGGRVGLFSYGSGSIGELITGIVRSAGDAAGRAARVEARLNARVPVSFDEYVALHEGAVHSSADVELPVVAAGPFRLAAVRGGRRIYEAC